ncbi:NAD(P)H-dependent glycerol-3-phosphate dehydrogenase [Boudabousia marimammalium]|uniref:Glycerol-3-phosphate dehydrogenase [NAD(P)+] n=1 Tax=Boudabousia marimammalium TaxID=156892 RepID=A0A1Q5PPB2_9ACTO|nr:NAD(P)H-dependent glycerol-3-phosphate dehydrogenase [Boudabousia marimammalium]OKL49359.1 hypothetical protein BM477_05125 [Boudabousia marimammalium]
MTSQNNSRTVGIIGAGAWGTVFAQVLADAGSQVILFTPEPDVVDSINGYHTSRYVPAVTLPAQISATGNLQECVEGAKRIVVAVPSHAVESALSPLFGQIGDREVLSLVKGVRGGEFMSTIISRTLGLAEHQLSVLSGPNLAIEIAARQPANTVIANPDLERAKGWADVCANAYFRPYLSTDVRGCEIGGIVKNVIALAVGASAGMGLGTNTRSALITRGLAEMTRLGMAMGAQQETFLGLAGIGDLVTTCSSELSRNFTFGSNLGKGLSVSQAKVASKGVAEGAQCCQDVLDLANSLGVEMPITEAVVDVIHHGHSARQMGERLLGRPRKMDGVSLQIVD